MLTQMLPLVLFMLIPVWIPVATLTVGALADAVRRALGRPPAPSAAETLREHRASTAAVAAARPASPVVPEAA